MNREYSDARYASNKVEDRTEGFVGFELARVRCGNRSCLARILFWDASGQFSVETLGTDVPLVVLEELIAEAKAFIKTT